MIQRYNFVVSFPIKCMGMDHTDLCELLKGGNDKWTKKNATNYTIKTLLVDIRIKRCILYTIKKWKEKIYE